MVSWVKTLRGILGNFWHGLFADSDFILGVENLHAIVYTALHALVHRRAAMQGTRSVSLLPPRTPYPILVDIASVAATGDDILATDSVETLWQKFNSTAGTRWQGTLYTTVKTPPFMLCEHACNNAITLLDSIDFHIEDDSIVLYTDPATLDLCTYKKTTEDGVLHTYYVLWGFDRPETAKSDFVAGALGIRGDIDTEQAWEAHTQGLTTLKLKQLLAPAVGAVVSATAGTVSRANTVEQGTQYICINDVVVSAGTGSTYCGKALGAQVHTGDTLYGTFNLYGAGETPDASVITYMPVVTPVGTLVAKNASVAVVTEDNTDILPLYSKESVIAGSPVVPETYKTYAKGAADAGVAYKISKDTSGKINAVEYIHAKLRLGHSVILGIEQIDTSSDSVYDIIRSTIGGGTIITVGWKTAASVQADDVPILNSLLSTATITVTDNE